jgi:hypothetical protein
MKLSGARLRLLYIVFLALFSLAVYLPAYSFTFWKDDWHMIWQYRFFPQSGFSVILHMGTLFQFFVFTKLFYLNFPVWQTFGILFKILASTAVALLGSKIIRSKTAGALTGLMFAVSYAGVESVGWSSANIVNIDAMFVCLIIYSVIRAFETGKKSPMIAALVLTAASLILDTGRILPVFALAFLYVWLFRPEKIKSFITKPVLLFSALFLLIITVLLVLENRSISNIQIIRSVLNDKSGISGILKQAVFLGQFFHGLFNFGFGWLIAVPHELAETAHGIYNPLIGRLAFTVFSVWLVLSLGLIYLKKTAGKILLFTLLWIVLFYLPNFLYEPKLMAAAVHRYAVLSNIGFVMISGYLIFRLKNRFLAASVLLIIVALNIYRIRNYFSEVSRYRNAGVVNAIWNRIDKDTGNNNIYSLIIMGEEPVRSNIFAIGVGTNPLLLKRNSPEVPGMVYKNTGEAVVDYCRTAGKEQSEPDNLDSYLRSVFGWNIKNSGSLENITPQARYEIKESIINSGCTGWQNNSSKSAI